MIPYKQNNCTCPRCKTNYVFKPEETFWDDKGSGYSTKLCVCPNCNTINVIKHTEDYGLTHLNNDKRIF